ncbi:hypothetical protein K788_0007608 [Paraburkholderia caribensis MBA4]|uniref:Uncharacterized protein n=1 Tax=Paraburkholderia caribensis MBA4 TaxID=1323664 RepID=A0A0P0RK43_9BURK|nr:hypothetical protein K788_0007608 [Paraburkholderia caribensis MBA4]
MRFGVFCLCAGWGVVRLWFVRLQFWFLLFSVLAFALASANC